MRSVKSLIAAGAATLMSTAAFAADMAIAPPPAYAPPPVVEDFGGWYLRGDIGFSNQQVQRLDNAASMPTITVLASDLAFGTAGIFGLGAGYHFNNWFRADVTGEYRGKSQLLRSPTASAYVGGVGTDTYHATKQEWVVLGNAYVDLGTWWCMTPFIGAGVGGARSHDQQLHRPGHRQQRLRRAAGPRLRRQLRKWNFAWALHAGVAYKVTPDFTVELAYRYLDIGNGVTGDLRTFDGTNNINDPMTFQDITSHDLKLGVRWDLDNPPIYAPPLIRKG